MTKQPDPQSEHCLSIMLEHLPEQCHVRNARTYVRTTHLSNYLPLGIAHRGVARISPLGEGNSRAASATRSLEGGPDA